MVKKFFHVVREEGHFLGGRLVVAVVASAMGGSSSKALRSGV